MLYTAARQTPGARIALAIFCSIFKPTIKAFDSVGREGRAKVAPKGLSLPSNYKWFGLLSNSISGFEV